MFSTPNPIGRVLVIAGGGAKGAYAFGCMKAFRKRKIQFDAVSGASAGALNAVTWGTGCFSEAEELWLTMSIDTVYPFHLFSHRMIPEYIRKALAVVYVFARILWSATTGIDMPYRKLAAAASALVASAMMTYMMLATKSVGQPQLKTWQIAAFVAFFTVFMYLFISPENQFSRKYAGEVFGSCLVLYLAEVLPQLRAFNPLVLIVLLLVVMIGLLAVVHAVFGRNIAALSQSGLAKSLDKVLAGPLKVPVIVSLSRQVEIHDPDDPHYRWENLPPGPGDVPIPDIRRRWTTEYLCVNDLDRDHIKEACLASAALPFGIVAPVQIGDILYADGGLTDNVPVFPFINNPAYVEVFVIVLDPPGSASEPEAEEKLRSEIGLDEDSWSARERAIRVAKFPVPDSCPDPGRRNRPPTILPHIRPEFMPTPYFFQPRESLGTVFSGTLRFEGGYAKDLIDLGYADTLKRLDKLGYTDSGIAQSSTVPEV